MTFEVELKFRLEQHSSVEETIRQMGAVEQAIVSHVDRYFNHPSRDFRSTDEAFRIRSVGESNCVTYKGAVVGDVAKTRHEIEVGIAQGDEAANQFAEILQMLGFRFVREVQKQRRSFSLKYEERHFELAMDEVPGLGHFVEIELLADDNDRQHAETAVWELAKSLGLTLAERRSYLDLLIESDGATEKYGT